MTCSSSTPAQNWLILPPKCQLKDMRLVVVFSAPQKLFTDGKLQRVLTAIQSPARTSNDGTTEDIPRGVDARDVAPSASVTAIRITNHFFMANGMNRPRASALEGFSGKGVHPALIDEFCKGLVPVELQTHTDKPASAFDYGLSGMVVVSACSVTGPSRPDSSNGRSALRKQSAAAAAAVKSAPPAKVLFTSARSR